MMFSLFKIAMNHSLFMGRIERRAHLANDFNHPRQRHWTFLDG